MTNKKEIRKIHVALGCVFRVAQSHNNRASEIIENSTISYQVLLTLRRERQLAEIDNRWELPGGKVEENELPESAVEREIFEETGYQVKAITPIDIIYTFVRDYPDYKQETFISCYECELISPDRFVTRPDSKIGDVRWFSLNKIDYFRTLVGSREFLFFLARKNGIKIDAIQKTISYALFQVPPKGDISKESIEKRRGREYVVNVQFEPDLSNYYLVTYHRGLHRRNWRPLIEEFFDNDLLIRKAKERVATRFQHGYHLIGYDDDFPIIEWIKKKGYPIQLSKPKQAPSQLILPIFKHEPTDKSAQ